KQLTEVADDCSFHAARAHEAQQPMDESREPVPEPCHESDVYDEPDEPRNSARESHPMRAEDGTATVHGGHTPKVTVLPGRRRGAASNAISDGVRGMETGLKGNLGNAWQIAEVHHVANHEHLRVPGQRTVCFDFDATGPVALSAGGVRQQLRQGRCQNAGRPDLRLRRKMLNRSVRSLHVDSVRIDVSTDRIQMDLDTNLL